MSWKTLLCTSPCGCLGLSPTSFADQALTIVWTISRRARCSRRHIVTVHRARRNRGRPGWRPCRTCSWPHCNPQARPPLRARTKSCCRAGCRGSLCWMAWWCWRLRTDCRLWCPVAHASASRRCRWRNRPVPYHRCSRWAVAWWSKQSIPVVIPHHHLGRDTGRDRTLPCSPRCSDRSRTDPDTCGRFLPTLPLEPVVLGWPEQRQSGMLPLPRW